MYLVAIAWMYVVLMIAVAEALSSNGTVVGAVITFVFYGVFPLAVVMYLMGTPMRRRARQAAEAVEAVEPPEAVEGAGAADATNPLRAAAPATPAASAAAHDGAPITAQAAASPSVAAPPDGSGHAPGDAVAPERKEI